MIIIMWKNADLADSIVIVENIHIVKRKLYINSIISILGRVIVNSRVCKQWRFNVNIGVKTIGQ